VRMLRWSSTTRILPARGRALSALSVDAPSLRIAEAD